MEIKHLRSFLAVAKSLNFSRAAQTLHLSQPALSAQIKLLEADLDAELFARNRRTVSLTPAGLALLAEAGNLLQQIADIGQRVKSASAGDAGHLRIGFVASATLGIVPAVALAFRKQYPGVTFELKNMPTVQQVDALRSGMLDAGFVRMPLLEKGLSVALVNAEPFAIVLPKFHPLAQKSKLQVADLQTEPFIAYAERWAPAFYQTWTGMCRAAGFTPRIVQETAEMDTAIALVAAGLGVAILPEGMTRRSRRIVAVTVLEKEQARSEIGIATLVDRQSPLLKRLVSVARQVGRH